MHEPTVTVVGNVAAPPRQRTTPNGVAVADFRIAATPRKLDRASGTWSDGETTWFGVTAWRSLGEHCAASLHRGDRVVVSGRLSTRSWDGEGGERRTGLEIDATSVGLELSRGAAGYLRQEPLQTDRDEAWASSGRVDPLTGEVQAALPEEGAASAAPEPEEEVGAAA